MSKDNKITPEQAFEKWLDRSESLAGSLNRTQNQQVQSNAITDEDAVWQQRLKTAQTLEHHESLQAQQKVPDWNRAAAFENDAVESNKRTWWQWGGLPVMSMAFSVFAMALVLFKVEFIINDDGMLLTFGDKQPGFNQLDIETLVNAKVDQKLQLFASEQQVVLANYAADIKVKQQDNNLQLASYIIGASRQERKEDIGDFIQYINAQRADDSLDNKIKFQQLESVINYQSLKQQKINYKPINSNDINSDGLGLTTLPESRTSEE